MPCAGGASLAYELRYARLVITPLATLPAWLPTPMGFAGRSGNQPMLSNRLNRASHYADTAMQIQLPCHRKLSSDDPSSSHPCYHQCAQLRVYVHGLPHPLRWQPAGKVRAGSTQPDPQQLTPRLKQGGRAGANLVLRTLRPVPSERTSRDVVTQRP